MRWYSFVSLLGKLGAAVIALALTTAAFPQESAQRLDSPRPSSLVDSLRELQERVHELSSTILQMSAEVARSRAEARELRQELQATREQLTSLKQQFGESQGHAVPGATGAPATADLAGRASKLQTEERLAQLEEDQQLLSAKVEDQYQTKVESGSKYRVRLSGIALLNVSSTRGSADDLDLPGVARPRGLLDSSGSFGATVRQSLLGLEVFGPGVAGAKSSGDMQFDFFGGFPNTEDGVTFGLVRLRVARIRLDWPRTSIVAGQDTPFFSPLAPTSLATLSFPALADSGKLYTFTPQIRVEHRVALSNDSSLLLQGGILDPLTGEPPSDSFNRVPLAGEKARQPGYAARFAWTRSTLGRPVTLGAGGYYARQDWGFGRTVDAWAGTADWSLPIRPWCSLTAQFYRGRAIGGLGAAGGRSVLLNGPLTDPRTSVLGLNTTGGWAQLKFRPFEKLELNTAFGEDFPSPSDLRRSPQSPSDLQASTSRNETALVNGIYHARSNLLFSLEYRRIRTSEIFPATLTADHINLGAGILF